MACRRLGILPARTRHIFRLRLSVGGSGGIPRVARQAVRGWRPRVTRGLRARMGSVVHAAEALRVDVRVDLRGRERAVAEELLDRPEVGAALEQMGRERVAETVWVRAEPAERARVEPPSARGEEERVRGAGGELRSRVAEITREPGRRLLAERDH